MDSDASLIKISKEFDRMVMKEVARIINEKTINKIIEYMPNTIKEVNLSTMQKIEEVKKCRSDDEAVSVTFNRNEWELLASIISDMSELHNEDFWIRVAKDVNKEEKEK